MSSVTRLTPRAAIKRMAPYASPEDPGQIAERAGLPPDSIIKLDANENPYGPSPRVGEALARFGDYHRYPDPDQRELRALVAPWLGVPAERVIVGNGSDEIIDLLCRIFLDPGDELIDCTPTFGMYLFSAELCDARRVEAARGEDWGVDVSAVRDALTPRTRLIFVASPNNPTGNRESEATVRELAALGPLLVVDEAYVEFSGQESMARLCLEIPNLVVLRTFSKWAGLAGLRVGLGIIPTAVAPHLWKAKPPFNVNLAAEVAVRATLEDLPWAERNISLIQAERERMQTGLAEVSGLTVWPSLANFVLFRVGPNAHAAGTANSAASLKDHLASRGIAVRDYRHPRLIDSLRISVGLREHTDALLHAVKEWSTGDTM